MEPFAVYLFLGNDTGPPMIVAGAGRLTHIEIRRSKECLGSATTGVKGKRKLTEFDVDLEGDEDEEEEEEVDRRQRPYTRMAHVRNDETSNTLRRR